MDIAESRDGLTGILALTGALDTTTASSLTVRAFALCGQDVRALLLDLERVPYVTSAGFRAFIGIRRRAQEGSINLMICGLNDVVHELFEIAGMLGVFTIVTDRAAALAAIGGA